MVVLLFFAEVAFVTWYAWPAARGWKAKGWTFVFAFWLPVLSWPWLLRRGFRARRLHRAEIGRRAQLQRQQERDRQVQWWLTDFGQALREGDWNRAVLAHDVLQGFELPPASFDGVLLAELEKGLLVLAATSSGVPALAFSPRHRASSGRSFAIGNLGGVRVTRWEGDQVVQVGNGPVRVRVPRS